MTRLRSVRMTDWRSIGDAEIVLGDGAVLLYGENNAGKSNVLAGIEAFCRLLEHAVGSGHTQAGNTFGWVDHVPGTVGAEDAVELLHPVRYGTSRATIGGSVVDDDGHEATVRFDIRLDRLEHEPELWKVEVAQFDGALDGRMRVLRIGEGRTFHEEFLPDRRISLASTTVAPDGSGVKLAMFCNANHAQTDVRHRYNDVLRRLVEASPFNLLVPAVALGEHHDIQVLIGDRAVEEYGAGAQQWILAAAMIATQAPDIVLLEEPETHLSWKAQQRLVDLLRLVSGGRQVIVATHSPHLANLAGEQGPWCRVVRDDRGHTALKSEVGANALWEEYGLTLESGADLVDSRKLTLFPGNLLCLHDPAVRHLGIDSGDVVVTSLAEAGVVRMMSLETWLGSGNDTSE